MKVQHHIRSFEQILEQYDGSIPLHRFLFAYFKKNKQMGSSDRKWATRYCYSFFRMGKALPTRPDLERLAVADFLCHTTPSLILAATFEQLVPHVSRSLSDKLNIVQATFPDFTWKEVFSFLPLLSNQVDQEKFATSFFVQPSLFIRVNQHAAHAVAEKLEAHEIAFTEIGPYTLALPNGTKLDNILSPNQYQVQDLSSQRTGTYFKPEKYDYWWDCCAASGGKSLLLHQLQPQIELLVSDVRESSLDNLAERFSQEGIKKYQRKVIDLLQNNEQILHDYAFDGILLDAPCSGSGTWGRTPEMLYYFDANKIQNYVRLQQAFATQVVRYLKSGKPLVYMTCSVFKAENEEVVDYILKNLPVKLEKMELITGYHEKADSLFVARFIKQ